MGGGYPTTNRESELSDGGLKWMVDELKAQEVKFAKEPVYDIAIYPAGSAHQPWSGKPYITAKREFEGSWLGHCSLEVRAAQALVYHDPKAVQEKYAPPNRPAVICSGGAERTCAFCVKTLN